MDSTTEWAGESRTGATSTLTRFSANVALGRALPARLVGVAACSLHCPRDILQPQSGPGQRCNIAFARIFAQKEFE